MKEKQTLISPCLSALKHYGRASQRGSLTIFTPGKEQGFSNEARVSNFVHNANFNASGRPHRGHTETSDSGHELSVMCTDQVFQKHCDVRTWLKIRHISGLKTLV